MRMLWVTALLLCSFPPLDAVSGTRLTVQVKSADTGRPIDRASVIIHFRHGRSAINLKKIRTSWETKTSQEGSVAVPEIPMGEVTIQVIAQHYQTFGGVFQLDQPEQTIEVKLNPPQAQYSEDAKDAKGKP
jgi:hypothetical protein